MAKSVQRQPLRPALGFGAAEGTVGVLGPIVAGGIYLSIQASAHHYCSPQVDGLDLAEYSSVEVALKKDNKFLRPSEIDIELGRFDKFWEDGDTPVAGWVPAETVEQLKEALRLFSDIDRRLRAAADLL